MFAKKWLIIIMLVVLFLRSGSFLDVTDPPQMVDIIVYLGGGKNERIEKTLEMYQKGNSKTSKIIFTGQSFYRENSKKYILQSKKEYFIKNDIDENNLIYKKLGNTLQEIRFVHSYMKLNNLNSVMFITDPPHSRRVKILAKTFSSFGDSNMKIQVIGSDVKWWNKNLFFINKEAIIFVFSEYVKIVYNYIVYGILEKYGWLPYLKKNYGESIHKFIESIKVFVYNL